VRVETASAPSSVDDRQAHPPPAVARLPIVIGVTGHRDIRGSDRPAIEALVRRILSDTRAQHPHTPLVLLSPLAEGADRLVARIALEYQAILLVPMPLSQDLYEQDFSTPESLTEFRELLASAEHFAMPLASGSTRRDVEGHGVPRGLQYALVGAYVARHCQHLIALWDGEPSSKVGGTGWVVTYKLTGRPGLSADLGVRLEDIPEPYSLTLNWLDAPETGIVYHILTPRAHDRDTVKVPVLRTLLPEGNEAPAQAERYLERARDIGRHIEAFNREAEACASKSPGVVAARQGYLLPDEHAAALHPALREMRTVYALADTLAVSYQKQTKHSLILLCGLAFTAALAFTLYARGAGREQSTPFLAVYLSILAVAIAAYLHAKQHEIQPKYLDYRALAEGLRVQFFWRLAGLGHSAADYYIRKQKDTIDWIRHGIRFWSVQARPDVTGSGSLQLVSRYWLQDERQYFQRVSRLNRRASVVFHSIGHGVLLLSFIQGWVLTALRPTAIFVVPLLLTGGALIWWGVQEREARIRAFRQAHISGFLTGLTVLAGIAVLVLLLVFWGVLTRTLHPPAPTWVFVTMGLAGLVSGVLHLYADKMAFAQHAKEFERLDLIFTLAQRRFAELSNAEPTAALRRHVRQLLLDLGKDALAENGDWVLLHRDRPLEVPKA
jgi:hypothetical protein